LIEDATRIFGEEHPRTQAFMAHRAIVLRRLERYDEATALTQRVYEFALAEAGPQGLNTLRAKNNLGLILLKGGEAEAAKDLYSELTEAWRDRRPDESGSYVVVAINYAKALHETGDSAKAIEVLRTGRTRAQRDYPADFWLIEVMDNRIAEYRGNDAPEFKSERAKALSQRG
jgi:tetratricopeptide (TPR) repeat protein